MFVTICLVIIIVEGLITIVLLGEHEESTRERMEGIKDAKIGNLKAEVKVLEETLDALQEETGVVV